MYISVVLSYTKFVQQYAGETFIVCPRLLDYITKKANLMSPFQRYRGKCVFSIVYGVSVMRLMCAPDSFLWDKNMFYMWGIFPCSFAQIDETTSTTNMGEKTKRLGGIKGCKVVTLQLGTDGCH